LDSRVSNFRNFWVRNKKDSEAEVNLFWADEIGTVDGASSETHANDLKVGDLVFYKARAIKGAFIVEKITGTSASGSIELKLIDKVD